MSLLLHMAHFQGAFLTLFLLFSQVRINNILIKVFICNYFQNVLLGLANSVTSGCIPSMSQNVRPRPGSSPGPFVPSPGSRPISPGITFNYSWNIFQDYFFIIFRLFKQSRCDESSKPSQPMPPMQRTWMGRTNYSFDRDHKQRFQSHGIFFLTTNSSFQP
jgi:hypothetical protein